MWRNAVQNPPSPRGLPVVGTLFDLISAGGAPRLHEYIDKRHRELGSVFVERLGPSVASVFVSDPRHYKQVFSEEGKHPRHMLPEPWLLYNKTRGVKRGLLFMEGEEWFQFRRILNQQLLKPRTDDILISSCEQVAMDLVNQWKRAGDGEIKNLELEMYRWSLEVILAVLVGRSYRKHLQDLRPAVIRFASIMHRVFEESAKVSLLPANIAAFLHLPAWKRFVNVVDEVLDTGSEVVKSLLQQCEIEGEGMLSALVAEKVNTGDIVRVVTDLVLAAGDTTSSTMQLVLYMVARDKEVQHRLREEAQLAKNILRETLRLYPVAPFITRYLPQECQLNGYSIPAGHLICMSLYTSGRDESSFLDAAKFWPDRWSRNASGQYVGVSNFYGSLPFGLGARSCIGRKLVEAQITHTITEIVRNFDLELVDDAPLDVMLKMIVVPAKPVRIIIKKRT